MRVLSRHVIQRGEDLGLCVVETDAGGEVLSVTPYAGETEATTYIDLPLCLDPEPPAATGGEFLTMRDIIFGISFR